MMFQVLDKDGEDSVPAIGKAIREIMDGLSGFEPNLDRICQNVAKKLGMQVFFGDGTTIFNATGTPMVVTTTGLEYFLKFQKKS